MDIYDVIASSSDDIICDICQKHGLANVAEKWCKPCKVCMCESCIEVHNSFRSDDLLIAIEDIFELKQNEREIDIICTSHNLKLECYCGDHEYLGCSKCVEIEHVECVDIKRINEYDVKLKNSDEINNILHKFSEYLGTLYQVNDDINIQRENLYEQREKTKSEITEFRNRINLALDKAEATALEELERVIRTEDNIIQENLEYTELLIASVEKSKKTLDIAIALQENVLFLPILIKSLLDSSCHASKIQSVSKKLRTVHVEFSPDKYCSAIEKNLETLGNIDIFSEIATGDDDKIQTHCKGPPKFERDVTLTKTINVCLPTDGYTSFRITGGVHLGNGKLIFCDFENRKLKLFHEDGCFLSELHLLSNPWDICRVDTCTIAVTQPVLRMISMINIEDEVMRITSSITTEYKVFGISMLDGKFVTTSAEETDGQIQIYDIDGKKHSSIVKNDKGQELFSGNPYHVRVNPRTSEIAVTQYNFKSDQARVLIFQKDWKLLRTVMDDDLHVAYGVDFDDEDNMYVCGRNSANVKQFSSDRDHSRKLEDCKDAHAVIVWDDKCLISSDFNDTVHIYQLE